MSLARERPARACFFRGFLLSTCDHSVSCRHNLSSVVSGVRPSMTWMLDEAHLEREWSSLHRQPALLKRKFLVLEGPNGCGKTQLAEVLARRFGVYYHVQCAQDVLDLVGYDNLVHRTVIFDNIKPWIVVGNKPVFIGQMLGVPGGLPASSIQRSYSPMLSFWNVRIIITSQDWTQQVRRLQRPDHLWLRRNGVLFRFHEPYVAEFIPPPVDDDEGTHSADTGAASSMSVQP